MCPPATLSIAGEGVRGVSTSHTLHCWLEEGLPASHQLLDLLIIYKELTRHTILEVI